MRQALLILLLMVTCPALGPSEFLSAQKSYPRVRQAFAEKEGSLRKDLQIAGYSLGDLNVLLVAHKAEKNLDVYVKKGPDTTYSKFRSYPICSTSGVAGPKRREGDGQIPEGFYYINRFNPHSSFYLSLGLNYPNRSDRILAQSTSPGSDIFIHGGCVTVGCLPMTDNQIKEIYVLTVMAKNSGQAKIPVYIFPFDMSADFRSRPGDEAVAAFWINLKTGFDKFNASKVELDFWIDNAGSYRFK